ncbi:MAG: hypothetical protein OEZ34_08320, partial [Spirochaetia bacterium]|nr:hypothetical protein [Spirochaetia bacterium]
LYYLIRWVIPGDIEYYNQIATFVFIVISVLVLFPARERILRKVLKDSEYSFFFGKDSHHLDLVARHFTMETLIDEIFPEIMDWLDVRHGRFAVIESDKKHYYFYSYKNGTVYKKESAYYSILEDCLEYLSRNPDLIFREESIIPEEIRELMDKFRAEVLQPIVYRKTLVGFLILGENPKHSYSQRALEVFADKAALSIHASILSGRVADLVKYDQEFQTAARIRKFLQGTSSAQIPGYKLKNIRSPNVLSLTEVFSSGDHKWYIVIVFSSRVVGAAGLILAGLLGHIYSLIHRDEPITLPKLINQIRKDAGLNRSEFKMDLFIAEFDLLDGNTIVIPDYHFEITNSSANEPFHLNYGWRNYFEFEPDELYRISHGRTPVLEIQREASSQNSRPVYVEEKI